MTTIGTAVLQIIPSLDGVSRSIERQLGGSMSTLGRNAGKELGANIASGVRASESDVKRAFDNHAKLADRAADATGKLRAAEANLQQLRSTGANDARIVAASERAEKARRDEARATRTAADALKDYERSARSAAGSGAGIGDSVLSSLRGAGSGIRSAGGEAATGFLEGFGGPIASLATKTGPIGLALAGSSALAFGVGKVIADQVDAGMATLASRDLVQARLGVTTDVMKRIADAAAKDFVSGWGESVQDNMVAGQLAIQSGLIDSKASEKQIGEVVGQLQALATVMDVDVSEAARGAGKLLITGVANSAEQAFDLITAGSQNGLNLTGDLIDTMEEYATKFRDVGLSGKESLGLINQMLKGGARNTDVAADGLKEFAIRVVDGSKTTKEAFTTLRLDADATANAFAAGGQRAHDAFGLVIDRINAIHDPLVREQTGVQLFGTKWEDMGAAIGRVNLSTAVESLGKVDGASKAAADKVGEHASQWDLLGRNISDAFTKFQTGFADSGIGKFLGTSLPSAISDALFPKPVPVLPPDAPGEPLKGSGILADLPPQAPVQGPGIKPPIRVPSDSVPIDLFPGSEVAPIDPRVRARPGRAFGGMVDPSGRISGPGSGVSDSILAAVMGGPGGFIRVSNQESINTAASTARNWPVIDAMNKGATLGEVILKSLPGFAGGGAVGPDVTAANELVGTKYSQGARTDCSGMAARVISRTLGLPETGLMSTKNAKQWLTDRGFQPGTGGPGTIRVGWYDHGPNPNDGHMAMTLSDGTHAESGGKNGVFTVGANAQGADGPQFDQHMFLPTVYGEGPAGGAGLGRAITSNISGGAGGSVASAVSDGAGSMGKAVTANASSSGGGGGGAFGIPTSISGLSKWGLDDLGKGIGKTGAGSDLSVFGKAAGSAISGQVSSALGAAGFPDAPIWLSQGLPAIADFIGGIKATDAAGNTIFDGANPFAGLGGGGASTASLVPEVLAAGGTPWSRPDYDSMMGFDNAGPRGGGPQTVNNWTINARDTEDAFIRAQRQERERAASKLSRF